MSRYLVSLRVWNERRGLSLQVCSRTSEMHDQGYFGGSSGSHVTVLARPANSQGPAEGGWGVGNGQRRTAAQRSDPSMEAAANLQGQD